MNKKIIASCVIAGSVALAHPLKNLIENWQLYDAPMVSYLVREGDTMTGCFLHAQGVPDRLREMFYNRIRHEHFNNTFIEWGDSLVTRVDTSMNTLRDGVWIKVPKIGGQNIDCTTPYE